jgi:hypothetical protein
MARVLAECAGDVLAEDDGRLVFVRRGGSPAAVFVAGLVTLVTAVNGLVQLTLALAGGGGSAVAGAVLAGLAGAAGWLTHRLLRAMRAARARPVGELRPLVVIDPGAGVARGPDGSVLAPLHAVAFAPVLDAFSSSRALAMTWPGGRVVVYHGNPFTGGSIDDAIAALRARGLRA